MLIKTISQVRLMALVDGKLVLVRCDGEGFMKNTAARR
jgi:hypothetical protein